MEIPGLADKAGCRHFGIQNRVQARVIGRAASAAAGHAKGHHGGVAGPRRCREKRVVGGVRARPPAFDVINADIIKRVGDRHFVSLREVDAAGLSAVAERGVEKPDSVVRHDILSLAAGPSMTPASVGGLTKTMPKG